MSVCYQRGLPHLVLKEMNAKGFSWDIVCFSSFFGQSGGATWLRVCYQQGLPRLVFKEMHAKGFSLDIVCVLPTGPV